MYNIEKKSFKGKKKVNKISAVKKKFKKLSNNQRKIALYNYNHHKMIKKPRKNLA